MPHSAESETALPSTTAQALERYQSKVETVTGTIASIRKRWSSVGYLRGILLLLTIGSAVAGFATFAGIRTPWFLLSGFLFIGFLAVAFFHERMQATMRTAMLQATIYKESIAQIGRDWAKIKTRPVDVPDSFRATGIDLDLFGESSLMKLVGVTRTPLGTSMLRNWMLENSLPDEVRARQAAVAELAPMLDYREELRLRCESLEASASGPAGFVQWTESEHWLKPRRWLVYLTRAISVCSLVAIFLMFTGLAPALIALLILGVAVVINFGLSIFYSGSTHEIFNLISSRRNEVGNYIRLFDMIADFDADSDRLKEIKQRLLVDSGDARKQIHGLGHLVWLANLRRSGAVFIIYLIFEFLFFWDIHVLDLLEKWKSKHGHLARGWFDDLGQWEALAALAKLSADHPDWVFPEVVPVSESDNLLISSKRLGHPLIDSSRIPNDVDVGPAGTVLLVTGSNMSGKSTLLRSIGVNSVLAGMGSVVCASSLRMPPVHIETSMRISDSLSDGVSFFMAELKRLKEIVDTAARYDDDPDRAMLFLLDEILQGTNSRERQIAVGRVVRRLIDQNSIGAISTHDLDLATTDDLEAACQTVHFSEQFKDVDGKREMTFDYRMQQGIAETTNALKLLEMVGLGES